ncbi:MAG: twin-arginine translocation signal domain-containing protein, partial [Afipia sp.]|nr:twin-arginine translocation signal domain-containing protein [Afipia sp.]
MDFRNNRPNRRDLIRGAAMLGAGAAVMSPLPVLPASSQSAAIRKAAEAGKDASIKRIRDWIALPSIAAENRNMAEGAAYMAELARDAGFSNVEIVPTDGHPGVFGTIDVGAPRTLGIYFMYDVKQFDPA